MTTASIPLPIDFNEPPWTLWCYKTPLSLLTSPLHTDRRSDSDDIPLETPAFSGEQLQRYLPQTNRYHAVWAQLEHKTRKAGAFSSWQS